MKMYIVIKSWVPSGHAVNIAAHAGLIGYLEFQHRIDTIDWLVNSFKKVTCSVSEEEFALLKNEQLGKVITESRLDSAEVAMVFAPRPNGKQPDIFKTLKLWK